MAPAFDDYLSGIAPETGYPDTFMDDIRGAYDADFGGVNAKVVALEAELAAVTAERDAEKIANYDLMRANMASVDADAIADPDAEPEDGDDEDGENMTTDDLFKKDAE